MNATTTPDLTRDQFLAGVRASGIHSDRQFDRITGALTVFQKSARDTAEFLVQGHWLTRFQAERLMTGKSDGFVLGPYVVQEYLTRTDTGRVYKALHRTMNRAVAVLVLRAELTANEAVREAIRVQARTAARLAHPNVLTLLDVNTAGERMYLVNEYVDGADAGTLVRKGGPLGVAKACELVRQAAVGLQHAHDKQTTHGRLGPSALLVGRPGGTGPQDKPAVKVSGLGLGVFVGAEGAAAFAAPELATNPVATPAADLFALGGVLHFLLTGRPPQPGVPVQQLRMDLPAPLVAVVNSLLSIDPTRRPASAADVAAALAAFATDDGALIDFSLPTAGPLSASALSGGSAMSSPSLPVGIPLQLAAPVAAPASSPFTDLHLDDSPSTDDTPVSGQAVYTPVHTVRRTRPSKRRGTRTRKQDQKLSLWLGVIAAAVVLVLAGGALALLAAVVRG
jgi:serine/threonine protein kinase